MVKINRRTVLKSSSAAIAAVSVSNKVAKALSAYTPDASLTAADLKPGGKLNPFGGELAGNADGTIPAWTGGYTTVPAGYKSGDIRPDPFAEEKPVVSITASNMDQYKNKLCAAQMAMFAKYSDYRMEIYPSHRTAAAPQWVYDYTYKNASNAQLTDDGNAVTGAYGGKPFPIPKNGHEAMWNHLLSWQGTDAHKISEAYTITETGQVILENRAESWSKYSYYIENGQDDFKGTYVEAVVEPIAPPYQAGSNLLINRPLNEQINSVQSYIYLKGERRVRRAPDLEYDTPNSLAGGVTNWDESNMFDGKLDEYDWTLLGMEEKYVPYNCNRTWAAPIAQQAMPHFLNPDLARWELHRVLVVEGTLKPGKRNTDARRVYYLDEDTGFAMLADIYDASGNLWKFLHAQPGLCFEFPCLSTTNFFLTYDLHAGEYSIGAGFNSGTLPQWQNVAIQPDVFFSPASLAAKAGGF